MSFQVHCATCGKVCGFIKNDDPKKYDIYGLCEKDSLDEVEYAKKMKAKEAEIKARVEK